jgi:hypothetical protein
MSVFECPLCDLPLLTLGELRICRSCAYRIGEPPPTLTHSQVAEATARYLAQGGAITRLAAGPARLATDVRLEERLVNGIRLVPWDELTDPWRNPDFNLFLGGRDVTPHVTSAQAAEAVEVAESRAAESRAAEGHPAHESEPAGGASEGDIPLELLAGAKRGEGG